jgi:pSer/pThr/pTyr-binding forkhead associated (FHA) protein
MELIVERGNLAGQVLRLRQRVVVVGRGGEPADGRIALPEQSLSRQHARFERTPEGWMVTDLGSTNGTLLNGQKLQAQQPYLLRPGDRLEMGGAVLLVRRVEEAEAGGAHGGGAPTMARRNPVLLIGGALLLVIVLIAIVAVLVMVLQPKSETTTATPMAPAEQIMTAMPVPTELQDIVTAVVPLISTELPLPLFGPTGTPTPEAASPKRKGSAGLALTERGRSSEAAP